VTTYFLGSGPITRSIYKDIARAGRPALIVTNSSPKGQEKAKQITYELFSLVELTDQDEVVIAWRRIGGQLQGLAKKEALNMLLNTLPNANRVVFLSSGSVYGNGSTTFSEIMPTDPKSTYANEKLEIEKWLQGLGIKKTIICRISNVYGSSGFPNLLNQIFSNFQKGQKQILFEPDRFERDYISIESVSMYVQYLLYSSQPPKPSVELLNLSSNCAIATLTILNLIKNVIGFEIPYQIQLIPSEMPPRNCLDNRKLLELSKIDFPDPTSTLHAYIQLRFNQSEQKTDEVEL
jgi:dTDP-D-glucose 4,6-dehydratase